MSTAKASTEKNYENTLLIPNMAPLQFRIIQAALEKAGWNCVMTGGDSRSAAELGLKYVHNDTCYPAVLIIGQFIAALDSGKYDPDHTTLVITQTGGGCRASNYYMLLKKALKKAGYENVKVLSANLSGVQSVHLFTPKASDLGSDETMPISIGLLKDLLAAVWYGDEIFALRNQVKPYEKNEGETEALTDKWVDACAEWIRSGKNTSLRTFRRFFKSIAEDFAKIERNAVEKIKVGVVGEIFVKFSPLGNNDLVRFLESEGCEVNMPGLMGFIEYCIVNYGITIKLYGGSYTVKKLSDLLLGIFAKVDQAMADALHAYGFYAPCSIYELMKKPEGVIHLGAKMGEGWLLTAEMAELIEGGYPNIVCTQPFGCLPNHIAGKGVINKLREKYPESNITPVDYDPGASRVNQENRIKLMLAVARENMQKA